MKRKLRYNVGNEIVEKDINYIPIRFILAVMLAVMETLAVIAIVVLLCRYVPYFYLLMWATEIAFVIQIAASNENPDDKVPWLLVVLVVPIAGVMLYIMFHSRKLKKKYIRRVKKLKDHAYSKDDAQDFMQLGRESAAAANQARLLCKTSEGHLFQNTDQAYFPLGEDMFPRMLEDLKNAEQFIFMEYFIIEEGVFWNSILEILKEKAMSGVEVRVVYDDIGCMNTLPGNYWRILKSYGIKAVPFALLKGNADSEFNNRSHRKILVIDGKIGYTGGVNIADEYINRTVRFGHWKDVGIRLEGEAVQELTKLFLLDYGLNVRKEPEVMHDYFPKISAQAKGYVIPFGDGPAPSYPHQVGKRLIQDMLGQAKRYVYMMSPYLIIDNELCCSIEYAAMRGIDVRIIVPHIPDKKLVFEMTRCYYERLMKAGVKIYEYEPGFIHAKCYLQDDETAMIGTINLDYRSLAHHFENGVWMYKCDSIEDIRNDFADTFGKSILIEEGMVKKGIWRSLIRSLVKIFAPML
ncbi:MAG: cardiolipin synthase [Clostridia bacterium]|nr:cardiolipin synthase [Clostridia bacterium]